MGFGLAQTVAEAAAIRKFAAEKKTAKTGSATIDISPMFSNDRVLSYNVYNAIPRICRQITLEEIKSAVYKNDKLRQELICKGPIWVSHNGSLAALFVANNKLWYVNAQDPSAPFTARSAYVQKTQDTEPHRLRSAIRRVLRQH